MNCATFDNLYRKAHLDQRPVQIGVGVAILATLVAVVRSQYLTYPPSQAITITSYNVLDPSRAASTLHAQVASKTLLWKNREQALITKIASFQSDIICLQEVDPAFYQKVLDRMQGLGYDALYLRKGEHVDGLMIVYKPHVIQLSERHYTVFFKNNPPNGVDVSPALVMEFEHQGKRFALINLKLKGGELARDQLTQLVEEILPEHLHLDGWLLCGDFGIAPDHPAMQCLQQHGFQYLKLSSSPVSSKTQTLSHLFDYICYSSKKLRATARNITDYATATLPSDLKQPSDHLPISALIEPLSSQ